MKPARVQWLLSCCALLIAALRADALNDQAPGAMVPAPGGDSLFIALIGSDAVVEVGLGDGRIRRRFTTPGPPSGLALSPRGDRLLVTLGGSPGFLQVLELPSGRELHRVPAGHSPLAPIVSPTGRRAYLCSRFDDSVREFDVETGREAARIPVLRQPVAAGLTPDGSLLFVANHLHAGRADTNVVAARVSVIDTSLRRVVRQLSLPNGSTLLRGVCVSPDGRHVAVTHNLARFHLPTTHVTWGWMNNAALSIIDVERLEVLNTVVLDDLTRGAANPWGCVWTPDARHLIVAHAGTHELSVLEAPALLAKLAALPVSLDRAETRAEYFPRARTQREVPNDFRFVEGLRTRVALTGRGLRSLVWTGQSVLAAGYFSDSVERVRLAGDRPQAEVFWRADSVTSAPSRRGEDLFNDARLCVEGWQSCASCHSDDGRVDALNWDLHNDGVGNPKNVRSLLQAFERAPLMSLGVRADAAAAIRAGIRYILFTNLPPAFASDLDAYVQSLAPVPSPRLVAGGLSPAARRGREVFFAARTGCAGCHEPPLYTDRKQHAVGAGKFDAPADRFYTPSLIEAWRTAPYLHDGSAVTLREAITVANAHSQRGRTADLSEAELDDLVAFLESL